jgi:hypothetical protein
MPFYRWIFAALLITICALTVSRAAMAENQPTAVVLDDALPGADPAVAQVLADSVRAGGYEIRTISADLLIDGAAISDAQLLVLPCGRSVPVEAVPAVVKHLESGRHIIACGLPLWDSLVARVDGKWVARPDYDRALSGMKPQKILLDFEQEELSKWQRATNALEPEPTIELADSPTGKALHVIIPNLTGWETISRDLPHPFDEGQTLTCFRAKGGKDTDQLAIEWTEKDSTRWIATVQLSEQWQDYALPPEAFIAWQPPKHRGGSGDHLHVENVVRFAVGLAYSHTDLPRGRNEYWLDQLGTAHRPFAQAHKKVELPSLDTLCPSFAVYPITTPVTIATLPGLALIDAARIASPAEPLIAIQPRPGGAGYNKHRPWRYQPILIASGTGDPSVSSSRAQKITGKLPVPPGDFRGAIAALSIQLESPYRGGIWAAFTPASAEFYGQPAVKIAITQLAKAIRRGLFLQEAGSEFYTMFENQPVRLGARVIMPPPGPGPNLGVRISVRDRQSGQMVHDVAATPNPAIEQTWNPSRWPEGGYIVQTELVEGLAALDRIEHELHVWRPSPNRHFITTRDGSFFLAGKPWKAHGVNYMPSSGIGLTNGQMFEHYLSSMSYDPEIIDRDLRRIKAMNLNAVSVFLYREWMEANNLLDLLRRCRDLGLHVNLSLRPGDPMHFEWAGVREMIEHYRLKDNDTVFAYDLGWETSHYDREYQQKTYGRQWQQWVQKRYGSIEAAEKAWSFSLSSPSPGTPGEGKAVAFSDRAGEGLTVPESNHLLDDGPWRKMVIDYRAFLDEITARDYGRARDLVRSIDPNHSVSFRMTIAGDPTARMPNQLPFDFWGLRNAVDIWEPEAYGRIGEWDWVRHGRFTISYARLCDRSKPLMWAEMGVSNWDQYKMQTSERKLDFQARFHRAFYRMLEESGSDGVFFWWYPGGYRVNERSDFGIINPDGTDRPATKIIRGQGPKFLAAPKPPPPDYWIEVDRDKDTRGLNGIYEAVREEYWRAIEEGKQPGLKWASVPGTARP